MQDNDPLYTTKTNGHAEQIEDELFRKLTQRHALHTISLKDFNDQESKPVVFMARPHVHMSKGDDGSAAVIY